MKTEWLERALCKDHDPELFYPLPGEKNKAREAVAVCKRNALDRGENDGISAGLALRQLTAAARRTHLAAIASGVKP
ncbi:WhiB family transcriptional regulator [Antrihabitans spumae]|uniref:WhiB family transcriptional regulator n=1 Tax=Antrihabitans spumae TaxID=3373370 RepID=A0ABW7KP82_9NOCA